MLHALPSGAQVDLTCRSLRDSVAFRLKSAGQIMDLRLGAVHTDFQQLPADTKSPGLILVAIQQHHASKPQPIDEIAGVKAFADAAAAEASGLVDAADAHCKLLVELAEHINIGAEIETADVAPELAQAARTIRSAMTSGGGEKAARATAAQLLEDARDAARQLAKVADQQRRAKAALKLGLLRGSARALEALAESAEQPRSMGADSAPMLRSLFEKTAAQAEAFGKALGASYANDEADARRLPRLRCVRALENTHA